jgi:hypothetical protein
MIISIVILHVTILSVNILINEHNVERKQLSSFSGFSDDILIY